MKHFWYSSLVKTVGCTHLYVWLDFRTRERGGIGRRFMKIYGPYTRKDGRQHVIICENQKLRTMSYPKYLLQKKLGRELSSEETCDHIDNDFTNNSLENLQVLLRSENAKKEMSLRPAETGEFSCPLCNKTFTREMRLVRNNWKKGKSGPYCSRSCAGKASHLR